MSTLREYYNQDVDDVVKTILQDYDKKRDIDRMNVGRQPDRKAIIDIVDKLLNTETQWKSVSMELQGETIMALQGEAWLIEDKDVQMPDMGRRTIRNLYKTLSSKKKVSVKVQMIPYFAWDNRGMGEMRIWFPYSI